MSLSQQLRREAFAGIRKVCDTQSQVLWDGVKVGLVSFDVARLTWGYWLDKASSKRFYGTHEECVDQAKADYARHKERDRAEAVRVESIGTDMVPAYRASGGSWRTAGAGNVVSVRVAFPEVGDELVWSDEPAVMSVDVPEDLARELAVGQLVGLVQKGCSFYLRELAA